ILLAEFIIGRGSEENAVSAYSFFAPNSKWHFVGILGMITCFILLSFYSVVGGWILLYMVETLLGNVSGIKSDGYGDIFNNLIANPSLAVFSQLAFMAITIVVVAKGVKNGIERASKIMMPALFVAFIIFIICSLLLDDVCDRLALLSVPACSDLYLL